MRTPIVSAAELEKLIGTPNLRVVDVRPGGKAKHYADGHIPSALYLDLETDLSASEGPGRHPLPSPEVFAETLASAGIGDDCAVVCYDADSGAFAARLWWMLDSLGHDAVAVLDGGLAAWTEAGFALEKLGVTYPAAQFTRREVRGPTVSREDLLQSPEDFLILDARAAERYRGEVEPIDAIAGHIPGALSAPFAENLVEGRFASPEALAERFGAFTALAKEREPARTLVHSCGSGVTACHNILAMRLAGLGRTTLYPGSWSDWSSSGGPVQTGA